MSVARGGQMLQRGNDAVQRVEEPVVGYVKRASAGLEAAVAACAASDYGAFFADGVNEAAYEQHERFAGAEREARGNEFLVADQVAASVAKNAGDGGGEQIGSELGLGHKAEVFLAEIDFAFVDSVGFIAQSAPHGREAAAVGGGKIAVEPIVAAAGDGEVKREYGVCGWEDFKKIAQGRKRIGVGDFGGKAVGGNPRGVEKRAGSVGQGFPVELEMQQAPRLTPQAGGEKSHRVFKVAALCLQMMGAQIHPLGPDDPRKEFHSVRTNRLSNRGRGRNVEGASPAG